MYIPLDSLYQWISSLTPKPACIYYFYPHGSRNLADVLSYPQLSAEFQRSNADMFPIFCNDQEPLNFSHYQSLSWQQFSHPCKTKMFEDMIAKYRYSNNKETNLNLICHGLWSWIYDRTILVHSEKNSIDLDHYEKNQYIPVHYWAHGVIARDWFRYASRDNQLQYSLSTNKDFLIYCRDWSGSREYRLKFLDYLYHHDLVKHSLCYFNPVSFTDKLHYSQHQFSNPEFITKTLFDKQLTLTQVDSSVSASYDTFDHVSTGISVVLETNFDGPRIQLTEKICRSLACGHPFFLVAGPGSLNYLKNYGFETFEPWLDESYDKESNSLRRLEKIAESMKKFARLQPVKKQKTLQIIQDIAKRNQQRFFSDDFASCLEKELRSNFTWAFDMASETRARRWLFRRSRYKDQCKQNDKSNRFPRLEQLVFQIRNTRTQHRELYKNW